MFCSSVQVRVQSNRFVTRVIDEMPSPYSGLFPGMISSVGSMIALTMDSGFSSYKIIGAILGVASIALSLENGSAALLNEHEKICSLLDLAKECKKDSLLCGEKNYELIRKIEFHFKKFAYSLDSEQIEKFYLILGMHELTESQPTSTCLGFKLTLRQSALIEAYSQIEKGSLVGLETLCKFFTSTQKHKLSEYLTLSPKQKILYNEILSSIKDVNEDIIYLLIQSFRQINLSSQVQSYLEKQLHAQNVWLFSTPVFSLLKIVHPSRLLGAIQPLSALWTCVQFGSLALGAIAVSYIFYQCFYSKSQEQIRNQALQIQHLNQI